MPAIGAALWAIGEWIVALLMRYAGSIILQALLFMGLRWVTHKAVDGFMHAQFATLFGSLSPAMAHVMGLLKADVAVSIILSAVVFVIGKSAAMHLSAKASTS